MSLDESTIYVPGKNVAADLIPWLDVDDLPPPYLKGDA